jgi:hypothetical protein
MGHIRNTHTGGRRLSHSQYGGEKVYPRGLQSVSVPCTGGRWGAAPGSQLTRFLTGKLDGNNNGIV